MLLLIAAAFFLFIPPLIRDSAALRVNLEVDALSAGFFAFMLPLIAYSAAFFLLMLPLITDSASRGVWEG